MKFTSLELHRIPTDQPSRQRNKVTIQKLLITVAFQHVVQAIVALCVCLYTRPANVENWKMEEWYWVAVKLVLASFILDTYQYWMHRWMHENRWLYRNFHSVHHQLHVPYAFGALYNHPIEGFLMDTVSGAIPALILDMHPWTACLFYCIATLKTVDDHCGYAWAWSPFKWMGNGAVYHDIHHWGKGRMYNYSQPFYNFWDVWMGTEYGAAMERKEREKTARELEAKSLAENTFTAARGLQESTSAKTSQSRGTSDKNEEMRRRTRKSSKSTLWFCAHPKSYPSYPPVAITSWSVWPAAGTIESCVPINSEGGTKPSIVSSSSSSSSVLHSSPDRENAKGSGVDVPMASASSALMKAAAVSSSSLHVSVSQHNSNPSLNDDEASVATSTTTTTTATASVSTSTAPVIAPPPAAAVINATSGPANKSTKQTQKSNSSKSKSVSTSTSTSSSSHTQAERKPIASSSKSLKRKSRSMYGLILNKNESDDSNDDDWKPTPAEERVEQVGNKRLRSGAYDADDDVTMYEKFDEVSESEEQKDLTNDKSAQKDKERSSTELQSFYGCLECLTEIPPSQAPAPASASTFKSVAATMMMCTCCTFPFHPGCLSPAEMGRWLGAAESWTCPYCSVDELIGRRTGFYVARVLTFRIIGGVATKKGKAKLDRIVELLKSSSFWELTTSLNVLASVEFLVKYRGVSYRRVEWTQSAWVRARWPLLVYQFWRVLVDDWKDHMPLELSDNSMSGESGNLEMENGYLWMRSETEAVCSLWTQVDSILSVSHSDMSAELSKENSGLGQSGNKSTPAQVGESSDHRDKGRPPPKSVLIHWKGLSETEATWERWPSDDDPDYEDIQKALEEYYDRQQGVMSPSTNGRNAVFAATVDEGKRFLEETYERCKVKNGGSTVLADDSGRAITSCKLIGRFIASIHQRAAVNPLLIAVPRNDIRCESLDGTAKTYMRCNILLASIEEFEQDKAFFSEQLQYLEAIIVSITTDAMIGLRNSLGRLLNFLSTDSTSSVVMKVLNLIGPPLRTDATIVTPMLAFLIPRSISTPIFNELLSSVKCIHMRPSGHINNHHYVFQPLTEEVVSEYVTALTGHAKQLIEIFQKPHPRHVDDNTFAWLCSILVKFSAIINQEMRDNVKDCPKTSAIIQILRDLKARNYAQKVVIACSGRGLARRISQRLESESFSHLVIDDSTSELEVSTIISQFNNKSTNATYDMHESMESLNTTAKGATVSFGQIVTPPHEEQAEQIKPQSNSHELKELLTPREQMSSSDLLDEKVLKENAALAMVGYLNSSSSAVNAADLADSLACTMSIDSMRNLGESSKLSLKESSAKHESSPTILVGYVPCFDGLPSLNADTVIIPDGFDVNGATWRLIGSLSDANDQAGSAKIRQSISMTPLDVWWIAAENTVEEGFVKFVRDREERKKTPSLSGMTDSGQEISIHLLAPGADFSCILRWIMGTGSAVIKAIVEGKGKVEVGVSKGKKSSSAATLMVNPQNHMISDDEILRIWQKASELQV
ncbi:hypothetical protein HDU76_008044 [Blyttiomyces sp. JEL0837]|nr:hypothetical protein HDU76_008044 [Blyttiomyces sp. JEL0837]